VENVETVFREGVGYDWQKPLDRKVWGVLSASKAAPIRPLERGAFWTIQPVAILSSEKCDEPTAEPSPLTSRWPRPG
jgi:hypothetical protein